MGPEQGRGQLTYPSSPPNACETWLKLYYFNPTQASINITYILLGIIPSAAGQTHIPQ